MDKSYFSNGEIAPPPLHFPQELNSISDYFLKTHLENSTDQYTQFNSALNSIVSSPITPNSLNPNGNFPLHEVIGKIGTICSPYDDNSNSNILGNYERLSGFDHSSQVGLNNSHGTRGNENFPRISSSPCVNENKNSGQTQVNLGHNFNSSERLLGFGSRSFSCRSSQAGLNNLTETMGNGNFPRVSSSPCVNENKNSGKTQVNFGHNSSSNDRLSGFDRSSQVGLNNDPKTVRGVSSSTCIRENKSSDLGHNSNSSERLFGYGSRSFSCRSSQVGLNNGTETPGNGNLPRVSSTPCIREDKNSAQIPVNLGQNSNSDEEYSVSEPNCRKRKANSRGKLKKNGQNSVEAEEKRIKSSESNGKIITGAVKMEEEKKKEKITETVKDYIHVRARRGEATDSHSLAERVRREKIGQRMKLLQDLVPGCNKVTGKALMLDEIINYVQSLQRQVEFLSMKLATVNPRLDFHIGNFLAKDVCEPNGCLAQNMFPLDKFGENISQIPTICEDELQSIVHMGFNHNSNQELTLHSQKFPVSNSMSHKKIEM